jgi:hypothetical protein
VASVVESLQHSTLNTRDAELHHKGYYEKLDNTSRMSAHLWNVTEQQAARWVPLAETPAYRVRDDFLAADLNPNTKTTFMDQAFTTNSWGMRDRERTLSKPAGVYRIALLGPSHVMGSGVSDENTFARFLEDQLNRSVEANHNVRYEVLNFGVAGYALTHQLAMLEDRVWKFEPDAVFFTDSSRLVPPAVHHLIRAVALHQEIPSQRLRKLVQETGVTALGSSGVPVLFDTGRAALESIGVKTRIPWPEAFQRLRRSADRLFRATLDQASERTRGHDAVPVFVGLENVESPPPAPVPVLRHAAAAGMLVFDLNNLWKGRDADALRVSSWDNHPNATGNRLIAARLYELIQKHSAELRLDPEKSGVSRDAEQASMNHPIRHQETLHD